jgi:hypothetical protein
MTCPSASEQPPCTDSSDSLAAMSYPLVSCGIQPNPGHALNVTFRHRVMTEMLMNCLSRRAIHQFPTTTITRTSNTTYHHHFCFLLDQVPHSPSPQPFASPSPLLLRLNKIATSAVGPGSEACNTLTISTHSRPSLVRLFCYQISERGTILLYEQTDQLSMNDLCKGRFTVLLDTVLRQLYGGQSHHFDPFHSSITKEMLSWPAHQVPSPPRGRSVSF